MREKFASMFECENCYSYIVVVTKGCKLVAFNKFKDALVDVSFNVSFTRP